MAKTSLRRTLLTALVTLLAGYCAIVALAAVFQRDLLFHPQPDPPNVGNFADKAVTLENDGVTLHGWLIRPGQSKLILYYGGNGENVGRALWLFDRLPDYAVLALNYRGYGQSEGMPGQDAIFSDALKAYDTYAGDYDTVVVWGTSIGTGVATYVASQREVDAAVLMTPYDSIRAIGQQRLPLLPVGLFLQHPFESAEHAQEVSAPAFMAIAGRDQVIPNERSLALVDAWPAEVNSHLFPDGTHGSIYNDETFWERVKAFLDKMEETSSETVK